MKIFAEADENDAQLHQHIDECLSQQEIFSAIQHENKRFAEQNRHLADCELIDGTSPKHAKFKQQSLKGFFSSAN